MIGPFGSDVVAALPGEAICKIAHLLTCKACAAQVLLFLLESQPEQTLRATREEAREAARGAATMAQVDELRHKSGILPQLTVETLLEASREIQLEDPRRSMEIVARAISRATEDQGDREPDPEQRQVLNRALAILGNGKRLRGDPWTVDELRMWSAQAREQGSGSLERVVGLSQWEHGSPDEAEGSLVNAAEAYARTGDSVEEGATLALLGLLHVEQGLHAEAIRAFESGLALLPAGRNAWLEAEATYGLALALAEAGSKAAASRVGELGDVLRQRVRGEHELIRLYWAEGRVKGRLGQVGAAGGILEAVVKKLVEEGDIAEATLARAHQVMLLIQTGEQDRAGAIARAEREWPGGAPDLLVAEPAAQASATINLLWTLRREGPRPRPMRFA